ncbi:MAG TPA: prolyl oligopeptidase family serine peptidase [Propionibacteriaceae bacterium]|nr:prolyl oligopeptidase family serine peptidase [Propionibacteriaceae bacterium]
MLEGFIADLVGAWSSWAPTISADGSQVAFVSDRRGQPELWVCDVSPVPDGAPSRARVIEISDDPVTSVSWSADGEWLACTVAPEGGVRTHVWVARPDGSGARQVAGSAYEHAALGPWSRTGHQLVVLVPRASVSTISRCDLVDPRTGERERVAEGGLVEVLDLSADERFALLRGGRRGRHYCVTLERAADQDHQLLPYPHTGSTESGLLRPAAWSAHPEQLTAYLVTDAGQPRAVLAGVDLNPDGSRGTVGILASRRDAELERIDADDSGSLLTLVWNVAGRSELELFDTVTGNREAVPDLPGAVITGCVLARNGRSAVLSVEGPLNPPGLWRLDTRSLTWSPIDVAPSSIPDGLVEPTLERFSAYDGLPLTGWLYRPPGASAAGPALLSFHGGPEAQERPTFSPQHQALVAAGVSVFAPNVRGSTGYGRQFAHLDDRNGRYNAIADVGSCVDHVVQSGVARPGQIAVSGRSYGGYLTLAALVRFPGLFAAGIDICGMSDLLTFYRDTEPWIAEAAVTKYGHPEHDRALLEDLSPLHKADAITAPLLVVHGEHDTNVPIGEARQIVAALTALEKPVEYLELPGEGHEYRARHSKQTLISRLLHFVVDQLRIPATVDGGRSRVSALALSAKSSVSAD